MSEQRFPNRYEEEIAGEETVEWQCSIAANDEFDEDDPEYCGHEPETLELDEPAYIDDMGLVQLPGFVPECPECGNPIDFVVNGLEVIYP